MRKNVILINCYYLLQIENTKPVVIEIVLLKWAFGTEYIRAFVF